MLYEPVSVAQSDKSKFGCRVDYQVFRYAAEMCCRQTRPHQKLDDKVSVADAPQTVLSQRLEAQFLREKLPVHAERVPCECTRAKRQDGDPRDKLEQAFQI